MRRLLELRAHARGRQKTNAPHPRPHAGSQQQQQQLWPRWVSCEAASRVYNRRQGTLNAWRAQHRTSPKSKSADRSMGRVPQRCYSWFPSTRTHARSHLGHPSSHAHAHSSGQPQPTPRAAGRKVDWRSARARAAAAAARTVSHSGSRPRRCARLGCIIKSQCHHACARHTHHTDHTHSHSHSHSQQQKTVQRSVPCIVCW